LGFGVQESDSNISPTQSLSTIRNLTLFRI